MFRVEAGTTRPYCDGLTRRSFLQLGVAGMAAVGLDGVLRARAAAESRSTKDTSVILLWLDGGPGHMDLYDLKPDAPAEYRGIWKPIRTNVPGFEISELFPKQAKVADKFSIVRSLHHDSGDHFTGGHHMLTGRPGRVSGAKTDGEYPSIGSVVAKVRGANRPGMPPYVAAPHAASIGLSPGYFGANYLGSSFNPFELHSDPNAAGYQVPNLRLANGLTVESLDDRRRLVSTFDEVRRTADLANSYDAMDRFQREAFEMVTGPAARRAFDLGAEDLRLRDRYGRNSFGQCTLLARRLVEAGATFVTVHFGGWDHHWNLQAGMEHNLPIVDAAVSSLFTDLDQRGLLDRTLVLLCGEFSRTPRMNNGGNGGPPRSMGTPGRDHWGNAMFCLLGGGGLRGGQIVGSTNHLGTAPKDRPCTPAEIHATVYHVLGIDPTMAFLDRTGRPVPILDEPKPIAELL
jgi:uncharacterized protein (DUF1501 family)